MFSDNVSYTKVGCLRVFEHDAIAFFFFFFLESWEASCQVMRDCNQEERSQQPWPIIGCKLHFILPSCRDKVTNESSCTYILLWVCMS
jgi:hypothetical protein